MSNERPLLVAVVDDDAEVRVALMRLFSAAGFATEPVDSEALLLAISGALQR